ncbi:hypothetical protein LINPERPRIM_LOCUS20261, partial [Linum perenne]
MMRSLAYTLGWIQLPQEDLDLPPAPSLGDEPDTDDETDIETDTEIDAEDDVRSEDYGHEDSRTNLFEERENDVPMPDAVTKPYSALPLMPSILECLMPSHAIINTGPRELMLKLMIVADQDVDANPSIKAEPMLGTKIRPPPEPDPRTNERPSVMWDTKGRCQENNILPRRDKNRKNVK